MVENMGGEAPGGITQALTAKQMAELTRQMVNSEELIRRTKESLICYRKKQRYKGGSVVRRGIHPLLTKSGRAPSLAVVAETVIQKGKCKQLLRRWASCLSTVRQRPLLFFGRQRKKGVG